MGNSVSKKFHLFFFEVNVNPTWVLRDIVDPCLLVNDDHDFNDLLHEVRQQFPTYPEGFTPQNLHMHLVRKYPAEKAPRLKWRKCNRKSNLKRTASIIEECCCRDDPMSYLDLDRELGYSFNSPTVSVDHVQDDSDQWDFANSVDPTVEFLRSNVEKYSETETVIEVVRELGMNTAVFNESNEMEDEHSGENTKEVHTSLQSPTSAGGEEEQTRPCSDDAPLTVERCDLEDQTDFTESNNLAVIIDNEDMESNNVEDIHVGEEEEQTRPCSDDAPLTVERCDLEDQADVISGAVVDKLGEQENKVEPVCEVYETKGRGHKMLSKRMTRIAATRRDTLKNRRASMAPVGTVARMMEQFGEQWLHESDSSEEET